MTAAQEFTLIALQLEWLESYLRELPADDHSQRLSEALSALVAARALVNELSSLGSEDDEAAAPSAVATG